LRQKIREARRTNRKGNCNQESRYTILSWSN